MKTTSEHDIGLPLPMKIAAAGLAGCTADLFTFPLDTIKVWLQVRGESGSPGAKSFPAAGTATDKTLAKQQTILRETAKNRLAPWVQAVQKSKVGGGPSNAATSKPKKVTLSSPKNIYGSSTKSVLKAASNHAVKSRTSSTLSIHELAASGIYMARKESPTAVPGGGNSAIQTIVKNVRRGGFRCFYSGLGAGLQRQIGFCSVRIGFYDNVKQFYVDLMPGAPDSKMVVQRILAGGTAGIMAVCLFQPTEVVKIRMQAEKGRYKGSLHAYRHLCKTGGFAEAWKGVGANCTRTAVVNVCELVTYDLVKETLLGKNMMSDNLPCHFASALISGLITTIVASPVDVVKTRYMNSDKGAYRNPVQCAAHMLRSEGFRAFYKGFIPSYLRLGAWNIVMFVSFEQYKKFFRDVATSTPEFPAPHLGTSAPLIPVVRDLVPEPTYPSYVEAFFQSHHEAGPIS